MGAEEGLDDLDAVVADLVAGRRGFNQLPKGLTADQRAGLRRRALEEGISARLDQCPEIPNIARRVFDADDIGVLNQTSDEVRNQLNRNELRNMVQDHRHRRFIGNP